MGAMRTEDIFPETDFKGLFTRGLIERGFTVRAGTIAGERRIRITSPSGRNWLSGAMIAFPMNSREVCLVAGNKNISYEFARMLDIPYPQTLYLTQDESTNNEETALLLEKYGKLVVKPLDGYKSHGITLNIKTPESLRAALETAWVESPTAIVQQQVEGEEYRFSVLDGKVISVLRRERPQVIGDGESMVKELIVEENLRRQQLQTAVPYPEWTRDLVGDALDSQKVLANGEVKILTNATMVANGASIYDVTDETHQDYIMMAERFAQAIGAGFVAVDMFIDDHKSYGTYWFNECNAAPALKLYKAVRNKNCDHVIKAVLDRTADIIDK